MKVIPLVRSQMQNLSFHERFCFLLREERLQTGRKLEEVARALNISTAEVQAWETATVSPPANQYFAVITLLGRDAFQKASTLWSDFQINKYLSYVSRRQTDQHVGQGHSIGHVNRLAA